MGEFEKVIDNLKGMSKVAYEVFMARDPVTFCKSHFSTHSQCDYVDNNMVETFNSIILARYKPIVSRLEDIRIALITRMRQKKKNLDSKFIASLAPRISLKLEEAYNEQIHCKCEWNGEDGHHEFEVLHNCVSHAVDFEKRTCSCRVWGLTSVPCAHAMSAILYMNKAPEDFIALWYTVDTYAPTYSTLLQPIPVHFGTMKGRELSFHLIWSKGSMVEGRHPGREMLTKLEILQSTQGKGYLTTVPIVTHLTTTSGNVPQLIHHKREQEQEHQPQIPVVIHNRRREGDLKVARTELPSHLKVGTLMLSHSLRIMWLA